MDVVRIKKIMVAKCFVKTQSLSSEEGAGNAIICVVIKGCDPTRLSLSAFDCSRSEQYIGKMAALLVETRCGLLP